MKITQERVYKPITITLETQKEADMFLSIIDKIDGATNNAGSVSEITKKEYALVVEISDWFTTQYGPR